MSQFNDFKLDSQLKTALSIPDNVLEESNINTGYNIQNNLWEVIVKYNNDLTIIEEEMGVDIEILSSNYAIITLKKEQIFLLTLYREIEYIEQPRSLYIVLDNSKNSSCNEQVQLPPNNLTGEGTLVAIIDSGINYTHRDFRNEDGTTRIDYIWDQTLQDGNPPEGFSSGTLYTREEINNALLSQNPFSIVKTNDDIGHGTAVAGIACGNGLSSNKKYTGVSPKSDIIVVKLGEKGRESFTRNTEIMRAIKFVLDRAIELNKPIAINISFGTNDGSHSGGSLFETYIDDMSNIWKTSIIVATGNEGSTSHHYTNIIKTGENIEIEISLDTNLSSLYLVLFKNFVDVFSVNIIAPNGRETGFINNTTKNNVFNFGNANLYFNLGEPTPYSLEQGLFFEIISVNGNLPSGIWKVVIYGEDIVGGTFNMWLPVTEISSKNTKFLKPSVYTTLTIPSTSNNVISVGGYNDLLNSISDFSGRGFTRDNRVKPDLVAPSQNITTTSNFLGYDNFSGTSFAAPFVTGACSLLMQWGVVNKNDLFLYGQRLKAFLRIGAKRKTNLEYPNREWGYGSLCTLNTLKILELYSQRNLITTMEMNNDNILNNVAYSEDYVTMVGQYNNEIKRIVEKYDFIKICKNLTGDFVVLYIKRDMFNTITQEEISRMELRQPFNLGLMDKSALDATGVLAIQNQPFLNLRGSGVLIGIVDTGINYTLDEFIYEDNTTKIVSIWDQTIQGKPPKDYCFGTEYTREDIDLAISSEVPFDMVPSIDEIGHGTKLASICAGRENLEKNFIGVAPDAELVVVKLKQANKTLRDYEFIPEDVPSYSSADLMLGIDYLYNKALELNRPLAICIGMGSNNGFHNGFSILEQYISNIAIKSGVCVSVCNGNEGNAQHHSLVKLNGTGDEKTLEFKIAENENGILLNIIAYPPDRISINIISPTGESTGRIPPRDNYDQEILFPLSNTRIRIQYYNKSFESSGQLTLIRFITPSPGVWRINIYGERILIGDIHSWLPIKNFIKEDTIFLTPDPFYTATLPSTANSVIAVGGYNHFDNSFFVQSGRGPTRYEGLRPIISAPAVNVSCINQNGDADIITGTSGATAISTGCSALILEWAVVKENSPAINTLSIIGYFISGAVRNPNELYPNNLWGFGKLNILNIFENM